MTVHSESSPPPKHALVVMPLAEQRGGSELALLQLLEHGRNRGVRWTVAFLAEGPMVGAAQRLGAAAVVVNAGRLREPHRMVAAIFRLRRLIQREAVDVVLSWLGKGQMYGGIAAALARRPALWFQHGLPSEPAGWQDRIATALPSRSILTCSRAVEVAQSRIRPHRPTRTIYPGVDLSHFNPERLPSPAECRRTLGLPATGPIIGIVARLQRWKGIHTLVSAMPVILAKHPDAICVIVGGDHQIEPDYPQFLRHQIHKNGLAKKVVLAGFQSNVPEWMQAMDVVVHASHGEPFGLVVIEAMALGKPTFATATAGPTEIITNNVDGVLWPAGDHASLAAAIGRLLSDQAASCEIGKRARGRAAMFDVSRYAADVVDAVTRATIRNHCGGALGMTPGRQPDRHAAAL